MNRAKLRRKKEGKILIAPGTILQCEYSEGRKKQGGTFFPLGLKERQSAETSPSLRSEGKGGRGGGRPSISQTGKKRCFLGTKREASSAY